MGVTLYELWQARYDRLLVGTESSRHAPVLAKVLRYLLDRYRNQPEAAVEAASLPTVPFWANERALVVHQYLHLGEVAGARSAADAEARVTGVLSRISTGTIPSGMPNPADESLWKLALTGSQDLLDWISERLDRFGRVPGRAVEYLAACVAETEHLEQAIRAATLLARCRDCHATAAVVAVWRERITNLWADEAVASLERYFDPDPVASAEFIRPELASDSPRVRRRAAQLLALLGTLHDVELLSDLLLLPQEADEDPQERQVLADAIKQLAVRFPPGGKVEGPA